MSRLRLCLLVCLAPIVALGQAPSPVISGVVHAGTLAPRGPLCPGLLAQIFGTNLGPTQLVTGSPLVQIPGFLVTINDRPAPILYGLAQQVNVQIPFELTPGPATVILEFQGRRSAPFAIELSAFAPGIPMGQDGLGSGQILAGNRLVSRQSPANPGAIVTLFAFGLGPTTPAVPTGTPTPGIVRTVAQPRVMVGGRPIATILFSGLSPSFISLYQIVFALPGDLTPGSHPLSVDIGGFNSNVIDVPIAITGLALTQTGFTFPAVQGGGAPSPKSFRILNGTTQALNFTLTPSTLSGGSGWLSVSPANGTVTPTQPAPTINISVNPTGLAPGDYYGQIRVDAPNVPNSPQFLSVVLNVAGPTVNPGPVVEPTGLVFVALAGGPSPAFQTIRITNLTNRATAFTAAASFPGLPPGFVVIPPGLVTPGQPLEIRVPLLTAALAAGVYRATLVLQFPLDNTSRIVDLLLVITPAILTAEQENLSGPNADCTATRLLPVATLLGTSFNAVAAWPTPLEASVVDDCGTPMRTGSVTATFSNNDPPLPLIAQQDGRWSGTWAPRNARTPALRVTLTAQQPDRNLTGTAELSGNLQDNPEVPAVNSRGVVNAASYSTTALPSPGELVSIFGVKLADGFEEAAALPLLTQMKSALLTIGGRPLPLVFTSENQINAMIPYDLAPGVTYQLIARRGNRLSVPEPVTIAAAEPAVFSTDRTGRGQGHVYVVTAPTEQVLADSTRPARAGDFLVLYCSGLGPVNPTVAAGVAVPFEALHRTTNPVTLTIGGRTARVEFAGLTPAFTGLYQVNTIMPEGVPPSDQSQVVLTIGGISSPPVTIAVR